MSEAWPLFVAIAFIAGLFLERWQCSSCRDMVGRTHHADVVSEIIERHPLSIDEEIVLDEVRVSINRGIIIPDKEIPAQIDD